MQFRMLGPLEVAIGDEVLDLGPRKQRTLFALLLTHHGRTVSTDRILDALWGDEADGKERALWVYISRLRAIIAEATTDELLVTRDHGYSLDVDSDTLDATEFERLAELGRALLVSDPHSASDTLASALALWRGNVLEEFAYDEWAQPEIARLTNLRRMAIDDRIESDLLIGRGGSLIGELEANVHERPFDETPVRQLMLALYRTGRHTEALRTFERFRRNLGDETGTDPSPELRSLEEQILFHDPRIAGERSEDGDAAIANPYRGLATFKEEDADVFFGRDRLVADLVAAVSRSSLVTVVGPSGSGKSSVVRSGVIPALRKGSIPGSDRWLIATMVPGSHPFIELEAALLRTRLDAPDSLREQLDGSSNEILRAALRVSPTEDTIVLVVVDQFEELFTAADPDSADRFLDAVVDAASDPKGRVRFVLTLRADFYDRPLNHVRFGNAMASGIVNVVPMAPEELEQAASGPARSVGVRLEPTLEAALIGDVLGQPGALPLFEFALTDLFARRVGDTLTLDAYRSMDGIDGGLSRAAERVFDTLTPSQREAAHQVFLRLVAISSDGAVRSRRRIEAADVLDLDLDVVDLQAVLESFGRERLLSFDRSERTGAPTVEVAHEALLERWERLRNWIDTAVVDLTTNARLSALATEWQDHGRADGYLLSRGRWEDYAAWVETSTLTLSRREAEYLEASAAARATEELEEAERLAREAATARRARRNFAGIIAVVGLGAIVVAVAVWLALQPPGPRVAYLYIPTDTGDIAAMLQAGFDAADRNLDVEIVDYPVYADPVSAVLTAVDDGAELIVMGQLEFSEIEEEIDLEALDTHIIVMDVPWELPYDNVSVAAFAEPEGAYLMGIAAASTSTSGRVGLVGGWQNPYLERWVAAYEQGARSVDPEIDVVIGWLRDDGLADWLNRDLAYARASAMYEAGVDVIFHVAGEAGKGVLSAATDYSLANDTDVWAIGADSDQGLLATASEQAHILTSMIKRFDLAVEESIAAWLDGATEPVMVFDLANRGVDFSEGHAALAPALPALENARQALIDGEVVPATDTAAPTMWGSTPDVTVLATLRSDGLTIDASPRIQLGERVVVRVTNDTPRTTYVQLGLLQTDVDFPVVLDEVAAGSWSAFEDADPEPRSTWAIPGGATYELPLVFDSSVKSIGYVASLNEETGTAWLAGPLTAEQP